MKTKRAANRRNRREMILEKAMEVFAKNGSQGSTIADIAKAAGIAQGTVYVYFESKEDLLNECMQEIIGPEIEEIIARTKDIEDTMERLFEFFNEHINLVESKPFIARLLTMENRQNENFYSQWPNFNPLKRYLDYVEELANDAIKDGRIRPLDTKTFAYMIVGVMDLAMAQWLTTSQSLDMSQMADSIRDIIRYGTLKKD
ncbi:MAG: TetR/AcrR family transcriptional regulator [Candidatus Cloacimonetes bacterium]|nr:TetR/AcrR family transcriptional regulator [Candidatus Cloacimonadota bacterium]